MILADGTSPQHRRPGIDSLEKTLQVGTLWKLPLPISAGFKFWLESTVKYSSFQAHASIMQVFLDHIALVQPLVFLLETALAISLMLGIAVRLAGIVGVLFILNLLIGLYNGSGAIYRPFYPPGRLVS